MLVTSCSQVSGAGLRGQGAGLESELSADVEGLEVLAVLAADRVLDRPADGSRGDGDEAELERDAEHHDVGVELAAEPLLAELGEVAGEGVLGAAMLEDLLAKLLRARSPALPSSV